MQQGNRNWEMSKGQQNIHDNLMRQVHKFFHWKTHNQSFRGNERYRASLSAFCKHLAINYRSKNFRNINDKHLQSFVDESKKANISSSALKTDLSAIRRLHSQVENARYKSLETDNKKLGVEDRQSVGVDRAWRSSEVNKAIEHAKIMGRQDVEWTLKVGRSLGLRIEEVTALTKSQLRESLTNNYVHLKNTKGGIRRDVPLSSVAEQTFRDMVGNSPGEKIFVKHGRTHKQAMKSIQNWIYTHRNVFKEEVMTTNSDEQYQKDLNIDYERKNLTFHGLRHAYAREQYKGAINSLKDAKQARKYVSNLLGHGRDDVTKIYLR